MPRADMDAIRDFQTGAASLHVLQPAAEDEVTGAWTAAELVKRG
jgi:hypothetical protein